MQSISPKQGEEIGAEHGEELESAWLSVHGLEEPGVPGPECVPEPPLHPVQRRRGALLPLLRLHAIPTRRLRGGDAHVLSHEIPDTRAGHIVVDGEGTEDLPAPDEVEGAVPIGEAVERRGGRGGGGGRRVQPVADGSHERGGGVGVRKRQSGRLRLRRRGGDGIGLHAGAEEDGERLRYVVSCHVTRPWSSLARRPKAGGLREGADAGGCVLAGGAAVPTFAVGFTR